MKARTRSSCPLLALGVLAVSLLQADLASAQVQEDLELLPVDGAAGDLFGSATAIDGGVVAVGARHDDDNGPDSGSAYLFDAQTGVQLQKLLPTDGAAGDEFGCSIAISGGLVVVGARADGTVGGNTGSAYVFDAATGAQLQKLIATDGADGDEFGYAVAVEAGVVAVGAKRDDDNGADSGAFYLFDASTGAQTMKVVPADGAANDNFGEALDLDGGVVAVGAHGDWDNGPLSGSAYLFDATTGLQLHKLLATDGSSNDFFGQAIAIDDGVVAVGAWADSIFFDHSGSAYLFDAASGAQLHKIVPVDGSNQDHFGISIAIDAGRVVIGAEEDDDTAIEAGSAYVYDVPTATLVTKVLASDGALFDEFGTAVAVQGGTVVVTAPRADDNGSSSGSAYVVDLDPCGAATTYCAGAVNSTGSAANIGSLGSTSIAADDLVLTCAGCPAGEYGIFVHGPDQTALPLGDGTLCVGGPLVRMSIVQADAFGAVSHAFDASSAVGVTPGATRNFQLWYRDPSGPGGSGFNLSDGLEVTFCD